MSSSASITAEKMKLPEVNFRWILSLFQLIMYTYLQIPLPPWRASPAQASLSTSRKYNTSLLLHVWHPLFVVLHPVYRKYGKYRIFFYMFALAITSLISWLHSLIVPLTPYTSQVRTFNFCLGQSRGMSGRSNKNNPFCITSKDIYLNE